MAKEKSLVEEAILSMKNLEEAVAENAKGILASTMKQEIKELVKESLSEQEEDEIETDADIEMPDTDDESDDEGIEMGADNFEEPPIDLTKKSDEEVMRVFKLMGPKDQIIIAKDEAGNINLKDEENDLEYMIVGESEDDDFSQASHMDMDLDSFSMEEEYVDEDETGLGVDDQMIESLDVDPDMGMDEGSYFGDGTEVAESEDIQGIVDEIFGSDDYSEYSDEDEDEIQFSFGDDESEDDTEMDYGLDIPDDMPSYKTKWKYSDDEEEDDESVVYEIELGDDSYLEESMKKTKVKGIGMGKPKFSYDSKPNEVKSTKKQKYGGKGIGFGSAKKGFTYDSDAENLDGEFRIKAKTSKKGETTEASRTLGNGRRWGRKGLDKPKAAPQHLRVESVDTSEIQVLREKNEEYRKALNVFRSKLNEVAVFNSNLAYATRLFTEHSTSKQEKINILRRFDGVETIKESKNLYKIIKDELSGNNPQPMNESFERKIEKAPSSGSAVNLIESKTYENPQFLRMKDLMAKLK